MKTEALARLGHDEKALVPIDEQSQRSSFYEPSELARPKAIEYLNKGRQQNETVRDFIDNAR